MGENERSENPKTQPGTEKEGLAHKVARTIGKVSGTVASVAAKVLPESDSRGAESVPAPKPKLPAVPARRRALHEPDSRSRESVPAPQRKLAATPARKVAKKKQKRKAHKRALKRSNTKG